MDPNIHSSLLPQLHLPTITNVLSLSGGGGDQWIANQSGPVHPKPQGGPGKGRRLCEFSGLKDDHAAKGDWFHLFKKRLPSLLLAHLRPEMCLDFICSSISIEGPTWQLKFNTWCPMYRNWFTPCLAWLTQCWRKASPCFLPSRPYSDFCGVSYSDALQWRSQPFVTLPHV